MADIALANTTAALSGKTVEVTDAAVTVTGLKTFDRDPNPPFAVSSGSAVVPNLDADKLDGQDAPTGTIVGTSDTQTLTNKTLTSPTINAGALSGTFTGDPTLSGNVTLSGQPRCDIFHSTTQSIANNTDTAIAFDSETTDVGSMHDTAVNTSRVTVPVAGVYVISGTVCFAADADGYREVQIRKNGETASTDFAARSRIPGGGGSLLFVSVSAVLTLAANDYIQLYALHTAGAALDIGNTSLANQNRLMVARIL